MIISLFVSLIFVSFRHLIQEFCYRFNQRMTQYSLRGQLIAYYNSILRLLKDFPNIRSVYRKLSREGSLSPGSYYFNVELFQLMLFFKI